MPDYPAWICYECGVKYGRPPQLATWHDPDKDDPNDRCGWCGTNDEWLTEPRDFKYPKWPVEGA